MNFCFCFDQKSATAVAHCKRGRGLIHVNGRPLELVEPRVLQYKLQEPILLLGKVDSKNWRNGWNFYGYTLN